MASKLKSRNYSILPQVRGALASALIAFNTGCLVGLTGCLIPQLENETNLNLKIQFEEGAKLASVYLIGGLPASLIGGYLATIYGRRGISLVVCIPIVISWIILATSQSITQLLIGRLLSAVAVSAAHPSMGVFISEISHPDLRGSLAAFPSIFLALGITNIYLLGWLLHWRVVCWVCAGFPVLMFIAFWMVPESPYWLLHKQRDEEAKISLQWFRGENANIEEELEEMSDNKSSSPKLTDSKCKDRCGAEMINILKSLSSKQFLKPFSIAGVIYLLVQWTGVSTMVFYMTHIFRDSGSSIDASMAPVVVNGIRVVAACFSSVALCFVPRKHLFCASSIIIAISAFSLAVSVRYLDSSALPMTAMISMFIGHSLGVVPVCQLIASEVFPMSCRSLGTGLCVSIATLSNALNAQLYHVILHYLGFFGTFCCYGGIAVFMALYGWAVIPETRNMSLAKIERSLCANSTSTSTSTIQPNILPGNNKPGISIIGKIMPAKRTGSEEALPKSVNSNNSL